ncbi:hypothetical protein [Campylobacter troglodytis]|uniref:hypothetical protein n=1 Tax=Campylobacter troglodytis TaxID=654363 RepID=UPI0011587E7E|nr:hypothetical protein [Campylobacter troglodytis]
MPRNDPPPQTPFAWKGVLNKANSIYQGEGALQGEVLARNDKISKLEQEIDTLVYALYDFNADEIALINK